MVAFDSETLFDAAAAFVATVAVAVFVVNLEWPYSPLSKYGVVLAVLAGVFAVSQRTGDRTFRLFAYASLVVSVLVTVFDVVSAFELGDAATTLLLFALAAGLFGLRRRLDESSRFVSDRTATLAFGALAAVAVVVLVVDVATGALLYDLQTQPQVTVAGDREPDARVATVVVRNPTPLLEPVELPRLSGCAAGNWSAYRLDGEGERRPVDVFVRVENDYREFVGSYGVRRFPVLVGVEGEGVAGESFPVRRTDRCPDDDSGDPYIALFEVEEPPYR